MNDNIINELKFHHMIMNLMKNMMSSLFLSLTKCNHQIIMEYTYKYTYTHNITYLKEEISRRIVFLHFTVFLDNETIITYFYNQ